MSLNDVFYPNLPGNLDVDIRDRAADSILNQPESFFPNEDIEKCPVQNNYRCWNNADDWDYSIHDRQNKTANWALAIAILGTLFLWPLCVFSYCMISDIKKKMGRWHRHYCKVSSAYFFSIFGIFFGIVEWIVLGIGIWTRFRH